MEEDYIKEEVLDPIDSDYETSPEESDDKTKPINLPEAKIKTNSILSAIDSSSVKKHQLDIETIYVKEENNDGSLGLSLEDESVQPAKRRRAFASELRFIRKEKKVLNNKVDANESSDTCDIAARTPLRTMPVKQALLREQVTSVSSLASQLLEISSQKVSTACPYCLRYSTSCESQLKKHVASHAESNMALYRCLLCPFTTIYKYQLKTHTDRHSIELGRHLCLYCDFSSRDPEELEIHKEIHETTQTFVCEFCGYTSSHKASFNKHVRKHGRPCPVCSYISFDKADMERHCEMHLVETKSGELVTVGGRGEEEDEDGATCSGDASGGGDRVEHTFTVEQPMVVQSGESEEEGETR